MFEVERGHVWRIVRTARMPAEWTDCVIAHSDDETMAEKRWEEGEEFAAVRYI